MLSLKQSNHSHHKFMSCRYVHMGSTHGQTRPPPYSLPLSPMWDLNHHSSQLVCTNADTKMGSIANMIYMSTRDRNNPGQVCICKPFPWGDFKLHSNSACTALKPVLVWLTPSLCQIISILKFALYSYVISHVIKVIILATEYWGTENWELMSGNTMHGPAPILKGDS